MDEVGFRSQRVSLVDTRGGVIKISLDPIWRMLFQLIADLLQSPPIAPLGSTCSQREPSLSQPWAQAYSFPPFTLRLLRIALFLVGQAQLVMAESIFRCVLAGLLQGLNAFVDFLLLKL